MKKLYTLLITTTCLLLVPGFASGQNCDPDVEAPQATCIDMLSAPLNEVTGTVVITTTDIDEHSSDACSDVSLSLSLAGTATAPTADESIIFNEVGDYTVQLWVEDEAGNFSSCWSGLTITPAGSGCPEDTQLPVAICDDQVYIALSATTGEAELSANDLDDGSYDLCGTVVLNANLQGTSTQPPTDTTILFTQVGNYVTTLWVTDEAGNWSTCNTEVTVHNSFDCTVDTVAPTPVCLNQLTVPLNGSEVTVPAEALDSGSFDVCSPVDFRISLSGTASEPPVETSITFNIFGLYDVDVWVIDEAGNWDFCQSSILIPDFADPCSNDVQPPLAACLDEVTVSLNEGSNEFILYAADINEGSWDNCGMVDLRLSLDPGLENPPVANNLAFTEPGVYYPVLWVIDQAGNWNSCWTELTVLESGINCQDDTAPPIPFCLTGLEAQLEGFDNTATIWGVDILADVIDNCSAVFNYGIELGGGSEQPPTEQSLEFDTPGTYTLTAWAGDEAGNWDYCTVDLSIVENPNPVKRISGIVFQDDNESCSFDAGEAFLSGWEVEFIPYINGQLDFSLAEHAFTSSDGNYLIDFTAGLLTIADSFELRLALSLNLMQNCPLTYTIPPAAFDNVDEIAQDLAASLKEDCYAMQVDIAAPFLRRCFTSYYTINYCNYGSEVAEGAYVEVTLDDFMIYAGSTIFFDEVEGNTYTFLLGNVAPGECGSFKVYTDLSCDAALGQSHCSEAYIYPDTPCDGNYTGPEILVEGRCDENEQEVQFTIYNIGDEDMMESTYYFVVEDVIMYMEEVEFELDSGDSLKVDFPGNGATYRLEAEQPSEFPWLGITGASVEGCGTDSDGNISLGIVTQFSTLETGDFLSIDCQQNIGAYDPNDKQASPAGIGEEHLIRENLPIDYKIRFQNTGTDTAFTVVVRDTLSEWLDPASVRPGASSHSYTFSRLEGNILEFRFDNIMLPDSNVNAEASSGFIQFEVDQLPDNPEGTLIENQAAIYFDFNEPILTNTVWHTVGDLFVEVSTDEPAGAIPLNVYPNPASESVRVEWEGGTGGIIRLFDYSGRLCREQRFNQDTFDLSLGGLNTGLYLFKISSEDGQWYAGKITITR